MKRTANIQSLVGRASEVSFLARCFIDIALHQIQCESLGLGGMYMMASNFAQVDALERIGVVDCTYADVDGHSHVRIGVRVSETGEALIPKYFAAVADELRDGYFGLGDWKWDRRSKFHHAVLARIA